MESGAPTPGWAPSHQWAGRPRPPLLPARTQRCRRRTLPCPCCLQPAHLQGRQRLPRILQSQHCCGDWLSG